MPDARLHRAPPGAVVGHEMIMASAGSGKTYALTNRFIRLLALGAAPERIVALTFTRKAAGEFFDEILTKLARAAADPAQAASLAAELTLPGLTTEHFRAMLRTTVDAMPRLGLGTFDAFFARIVRAFPLELGLGGDFTLLEDYAAQFERRRVLRQLFARRGNDPDTAQAEFIESFKRATFGLEEKYLARLLDDYINRHHHHFRTAPDAAQWGHRPRIWPRGCPWLRPADPAPAVLVLREWLADAPIAPKQRGRWTAFLEKVESYAAGARPPDELVFVLEKALDAWSALQRGDAVLEFDRARQTLGAAACAALGDIVQHIFEREFSRRLEATRGIHGILTRYDAGYETLVRRAGRLTFSDVEHLLRAGGIIAGPGADDELLGLGAGERRLMLEWRLDGQFDHWLLDEFQDTSRGQWDVLHNLLDEVIQDASRARTFFCVGDVKQAIYGWRGGDSRLFHEILTHYNSSGTRTINLQPMDASYRSGPAVLELVNQVFGGATALAGLSRVAGARWTQDWRPHTSAVPAHTGQAAWVHARDDDEAFRHTLGILQAIDPGARGLSVAVLTQKNKTAATFANRLRGEGKLPAVAEADLEVCTDNPATMAVLALLKAAAHPGDTLAWAHAHMTPLADIFVAEEIASPDTLTRRVLRQVHADGFEATIEWWWLRLERRLAADDIFSPGRGRQLVEAARRFDESGIRDIAEFLEFAARHVVRDTESPGVIRVMTIHKAKGLGFDVVILPDLEGTKLAERRKGLAVHRGADHGVEWVLDLPNKLFHERDPVLAGHVEAEEAEACYEKIALLYVALTRAKRAMYLITTSGADTTSQNYPRLLAGTLGTKPIEVAVGAWRGRGAFSAGDGDWFTSVKVASPTLPASAPVTLAQDVVRPVARLIPRTPSEQRQGSVQGAALFAAGRYTGADFGTAVHEMLAAVEWWDPAGADAWAGAQRASGRSPTAIDTAIACLGAASLAGVFQKPSADAPRIEVWRERPFELAHDGVWITGRFDRVLIERDSDGEVVRARVIDFKTDRVDPAPETWPAIAERYRPQSSSYRRAAAVLTGVPESRVSCEIILTGARTGTGELPGPFVI